ncbi:PEPxxWA-CTERM sorting domain-containing protein [Sandarakinorhabdus oryzae]|uniref:PEPxxWA-CTERM sorting domain-containing protein n=1 Tax=Sandarakinorhabdus oryzae TaxID=2675220 RepID=UPI001F187ED6|nr:PEPxxWA-CTERM sorting domain-containing protein [Sandarakinorhabdus oryzae]
MRLLAVIAAAAVLAMPASATVLFSQNFDAVTTGSNKTSIPGFTITGGVDLVNSGGGGITCVGGVGRCLDMVGSPNVGAITSTLINFNAGSLITVSFDLSGNQRLTSTDAFNFALNFTNPETIGQFTLVSGFQGSYGGTGVGLTTFGTYNEVIARTRPYVNYVLSFVPTTSGSFRIRFGVTGNNDGRGPILDNVAVNSTVVPEPNSWAMLIAGFAFVGFAARRRRSHQAA